MKYTVQIRNPASGSYWYETILADNIDQARMNARSKWGYFVEQIRAVELVKAPADADISISNDPNNLD
jgi:hypothetical protein